MFAAGKAASGAEPTDAQFNYVTMLLHGNGTNGAQNNTFLDSSTNNFSITRNGNTTQGTFTPYGSNWSNYFDGSGDRLTVPANAAFNFSTGDFTVECWFYTNTVSGNQWIVGPDNTVTYPWVLQTTGSSIRFISNNAANDFRPTSFTLTTGTWNHFAVTRSGSTMYWFTNGTLNGTQTYSTAIGSNTLDVQIGTTGSGSGDPVNGYVSNLRVVKGTAVYTSSFTPSTTPLTAISGTSLLTCQSNRFIDNSSNAFTITKYNDTSVQRFSPFSPTTAYSTGVIGGSGYFDGSGDYLTAPDSASTEFGSGDFTVECWVYYSSTSGTPVLIDKRANTGGYSPFIFYTTGGTLVFYSSSNGSSYDIANGVTIGSVTTGAWYHVAASRSGTSIRLFLNGVLGNTVTTSASLVNNSDAWSFGGTPGGNYLTGYLSNIRFVTGSAVYTSAFTPPTAPLTAITNTSLLLSYTNAGILDNAMMNDLETVGNAQISTSVKKYGTGSMYFDGTGDYLQGPNNPNLQMGSGSFTIEMWLYTPSLPSAYKRVFGITAPTISAATDESVNLEITNTNKMGATCVVGSTYYSVTDTTDIPTNTWTHWAFVRNGSTLTLYRDGTSVSSTSISGTSNWSTTFNVYVGRWVSSSARDYNGYIDDLRITKGVARYTTTFTPPTAAFPNN